MAKMTKRFFLFALAALLTAGGAAPGQAALFDVSPVLVVPGPPAAVGTGFPQWYQDFSGPLTRPDANPNYGTGLTPGGLKLELCPVGNPLCLSDAVGDEFFWWDTSTTIPVPAGGALAGPGSADLILATEGTTAAAPVVFSRSRIRVDVPVAGTYTVTHPYGVNVYNVTAPGIRGINDSLDQGCAAGTINCDFRLALNTQIGPYLFWDAGLPILDGAGVADDNFFIGDAATPHKILGSPNGTNFFRVDGPPGSNLGGPGIDFIQTDLFTVMGKVFTAGGTANTAPVAVPEAVATLAGTPVEIDVLANDTFTDVPINPGSLTITTPVGGTAAMTVVDGRVKATFTPATGFTGEASFTYTVSGFAGMVSAPATVTVIVEDLKVAKAEFRPKFLKWRVSGTSSDTTANSIGIQVGPPTVNATLSGAQENPPIVTAASGSASVTAGATSLDFTLSLSGLLNITSTHLHLGGAGTDGPVLFTLGGLNVSNASGTLTAADLPTPLPAGIASFADAVNAILSGNAYIQVHTQAVPAGEIRGQLGPNRLVGSAVVQGTGSNGTWSFDGKSDAFPDATRTISVRSSNGVQVIDLPVKLK